MSLTPQNLSSPFDDEENGDERNLDIDFQATFASRTRIISSNNAATDTLPTPNLPTPVEAFSSTEDETVVEVPLRSQRTARLSLSAQAQMILVRKRTRRWHAALAGAIAGGLAIIWEGRSRRGVIAQQLFVR